MPKSPSDVAKGLKVKRVSLDSLQVDQANMRRHPERNMAMIRASLDKHGQVEPLIVQSSTGKLIGGNGRFAAMVELGWTECDVVMLDVDDVTASEIALKLNRSAELSQWSDDLWSEVERLAGQGVDLEALGWTEEELQLEPEKPVKLNSLSIKPPPAMSWVLVGIPTVRFREIASTVKALAAIPGICCETCVSAKNEAS